MINNADFFKVLKNQGYDFITGVPCSLLEAPLNFLEQEKVMPHIKAANEGQALAIAGGAYLAGRQPVVYLQNSGLGNIINPLTSLHQLYDLPALLLVTWRGRPELVPEDAIEHVIMGKKMKEFFKLLDIPYRELAAEPVKLAETIDELTIILKETKKPVALLIREKLFVPCVAPTILQVYELSRLEAIQTVLKAVDEQAIVIGTTGMTSRDLWTYREQTDKKHHHDFYVVGSMGAASSLGLGLASMSTKPVVIFDGDGAVLMQMGALSTVGAYHPDNLLHIVLNNETHSSTGGQRTTANTTDFATVARAAGYPFAVTVTTKEELEQAVRQARVKHQLSMIVVKIKSGNLAGVARVELTPPVITDNISHVAIS